MKLSKTALILVFLLTFCTLAYAQKPNWTQVYSKTEANVYLDKSTCKTYTADNQLYIDAWLKVTLNTGDYSLAHFIFKVHDLSYTAAEINTYTASDKLIDSKSKSPEGWKTPAPGSNLENILKNTAAIMRNIDLKTPAEPKN